MKSREQRSWGFEVTGVASGQDSLGDQGPCRLVGDLWNRVQNIILYLLRRAVENIYIKNKNLVLNH